MENKPAQRFKILRHTIMIACFMLFGISTSLEAQDYEQGVKELTYWISIRPKEPCYYYIRGTFYHALQNYKAAIEDASKAIDLNVREHKSWGKTDQNIREILKELPTNLLYGCYILRGESFAYTKQYEKAIDEFNEARRLEPSEINVLVNRTQAYFALGRYEEALNDVNATNAVESRPDLLNFRSTIYVRLGRFTEAIVDVKKMMATDPENYHLKSLLGYLYYSKKDMKTALDLYEEVLEHIPNDFVTICERAKLNGHLGRYELAIADEGLALELVPLPSGSNYLVNKTLYFIEAGKYDEAKDLYAQLQKNNYQSYLDDGNHAYLKKYIDITTQLMPMRKYEEILPLLREVEANTSTVNTKDRTELDVNHACILAKIGFALEQLNKKGEALAYYKRSLIFNPFSEIVNEKVKLLNSTQR